MRATLRALVILFCLASFAVIGGGHWAVLQTMAWAQMTVRYSQDTGSLRQGLINTFDGAHPCELCQKVSAGIEKESRSERQNPLRNELLRKGKLTAVLPISPFVPPRREGKILSTSMLVTVGRAADAPPVPPPRAA